MIFHIIENLDDLYQYMGNSLQVYHGAKGNSEFRFYGKRITVYGNSKN